MRVQDLDLASRKAHALTGVDMYNNVPKHKERNKDRICFGIRFLLRDYLLHFIEKIILCQLYTALGTMIKC